MSFETNKFAVVKKKRLEKSEFSVECNVPIEAEIDKILSVCHSAAVDSAEILNGSVNYAGTIDLCMIYCTMDGEVGTLNSSCPFTSKFEDSDIQVGDKAGIKVEVESYQIDSVTSSNIKITCRCVQSGIIIANRDVSHVGSDDENMCCKEEEIFVNTFVGQAQESTVIDSELSIKEPIKKILLSDSQVSIKNVESGVNFVSVGGEVVTRLLYLTEKDRFETSYTTENFKEEIELEGVTRESISEAEAWVKKSEVKCEVEESDKGVDVKLSIPVEIKVMSYQEQSQIVVGDIYCTENELEVSAESFGMSRQIPGDHFEAKIDGTLTLDEDKPRVDKILFVGGSNLMVTNAYVKSGEVFVEGVTKTNVVYLNDESNSINSVVIEVPFVVSDKSSATCDDAKVNVCAVLFDVDVVIKKGREFYFDAKLKIGADYDCDETGAVISAVTVGSALPEKDCAIELMFGAAGQDSWEVAKSLKVREDTVLMQNPEVTFPLEQDENIVVYYQKR